MNRGDHQEDLFQDRKDREVFLETLGEAREKTRWLVHAYVLIRQPGHEELLLDRTVDRLEGMEAG